MSGQTIQWSAILAFAACLAIGVIADLIIHRTRRPRRRRRGFRNYKSMHQIARERKRTRRDGFRY